VPDVRPFRALRYALDDPATLAAVTAPPYDVIDDAARVRLAARDARNVVRLDSPVAEPGEDPDERYRRASRTLAAWRGEAILRQDSRPAVYVYEQEYALPGADGRRRTRTGMFARVRLEPFGPDSGIRRHEQTLHGPKEDRYRLLRATGVNTSPVVGLYDDPSGGASRILDEIRQRAPVAALEDDAGIRHRLWMASPEDAVTGELCRIAGASPITIADGHHRYETALRYRDERRVGAVPEPDPGYDFVLMLLLEPGAGRLDVLATHRVLRGLGPDGLARLRAGLADWFEVSPTDDRAALAAAFAPGAATGGAGRFGLWTRDGGALLSWRRQDVSDGRTVGRLDVARLGLALEGLAGLDAAAVAGGDRLAYTHDAQEALIQVDGARDDADAAFLLDGTPPEAIVAVAAEGDVMPQKSTYIYPKALTGLVIAPLEP
jgi:uncharacterized protein (DUF1015 family)